MSRSAPSLTVYVPGLAGPQPMLQGVPAGDWPSVRGLETLLSRAEPRACDTQGFEHGLFGLFGVPVEAGKDLPVAALSRLHDGGEPDGQWWLRADPVYVQIDRDRALVLAHEALALRAEEARELGEAVATAFAELGWRLEVRHPHRWYLQPGTATCEPALQTTPLGEALGRDMHNALPRGRDARRWHQYLNEAQMILHACPVNTAREQAGRLPVNSLWFWGGGVLPPTVAPRFRLVLADDPLACGLALHSGTVLQGLPEDADALMQDGLARGGESGNADMLLVVDSLYQAVIAADADDWLGALDALQTRWLLPLAEALRRGDVGGLTLVSDQGRGWTLDRRALRRWWRRRRPLGTVLAL